MLTFLQATVELVELKDGVLVFRSPKRFPEGKEAQIRIAFTPGKLSTLRVHVDSARPAEQGKTVHVSRVLGQAPELAALEIAGEARGEALRNATRHTLGLRVMSRDLPGFHGMTVDLSRTGLQVEITGMVDVGKKVALSLEFDRFDLPKLDCVAQVMWCRSHQVRENQRVGRDNKYRAGLKFDENQGADVHAKIKQISDFFEQRSHEDLGSLLDYSRLLKDEEVPPSVNRTPAAPVATPASVPLQTPPARPEAEWPSAKRTSFVMPVDALISGYRWEMTGTLLVVLRSDDGDDHGLEFPNCRTLRDNSCGQHGAAAALRTSSSGELTAWAAQRHGAAPWRHYEFLDAQGTVILEILSTPIREHEG